MRISSKSHSFVKKSASVIENHYKSHTASSYEEASIFASSSSSFTQFVCDQIRVVFDLNGKSNDDNGVVLLDVGGGTGHCTRMVLEGKSEHDHKKRYRKGIVLDPYLEANSDIISSSNESKSEVPIEFVKLGAQIFKTTSNGDGKEDNLAWRHEFNLCLMKEMVHHLGEEERVDIFRGIRSDLHRNSIQQSKDRNLKGNSPALLIVTRPKWNIDYPFYNWDEVREVWATNQPGVEDIEQDLRDAGFNNVEHSIVAFKCSPTINKWIDMIKNRCWSTFNHFSDSELDIACENILEQFRSSQKTSTGDDLTVEFEERLLFVTASLGDVN